MDKLVPRPGMVQSGWGSRRSAAPTALPNHPLSISQPSRAGLTFGGRPTGPRRLEKLQRLLVLTQTLPCWASTAGTTACRGRYVWFRPSEPRERMGSLLRFSHAGSHEALALPALKRVIRAGSLSQSAKALLPPRKCGGSHGLKELHVGIYWRGVFRLFVKFDIFGSFLRLVAQRGRRLKGVKGFFFMEKGIRRSGTEVDRGT
jgi:hypothetical protein